VFGRRTQRVGAGGGGGDVVAADRQVDPQCAQDLRFVVDNQH
jgi:hypothetical protein